MSLKDAPLSVEWLRNLADIARLESEWRALEGRCAGRSIFATYDFLMSWYSHYGGRDLSGAPLVGLVRDGDELIGIAALVIRRVRIGLVPVRQVTFAGYNLQAGEFLIDTDRLEALDALMRSLLDTVDVDVVSLSGLSQASPAFESLERALKGREMQVETDEGAYALVDLRGGYDAHRSALDGKSRRNLKRVRSRATALGQTTISGLRFDAAGPVASGPVIDRCIAIVNASWKVGDGREAMAECHQRFYHALGERFGPRKMLDLAILTINGEDAAFVMALVEHGMYYDVTVAYAAKFKEAFPGIFLMDELLQELPGRGINTVISHGGYEYKRNWASRFVSTTKLYIFQRGPRARCAHFSRYDLKPRWQSARELFSQKGRWLGSIRFGGHLPKGEYDVDPGGQAGKTNPAEVQGGLPSGRCTTGPR